MTVILRAEPCLVPIFYFLSAAQVLKLSCASTTTFAFVDVSSISPAVLLQNSSLAEKRFQTCLKILCHSKRVTAVVADEAVRKFSAFIECGVSQSLKEFRESDHRLDHFCRQCIGTKEQFSTLWKCVKVCVVHNHHTSNSLAAHCAFAVFADFSNFRVSSHGFFLG